ncbi:MAG: hypothetical protein WBC45_07090 [Atribacterota bacterium]
MSERMVNNLCEMVSLSSESGEEKEFIEFIKTKFQQEFNGRCQVDSYGHLIYKIPSKNSLASEPLILAAHADTVRPGKGVKPVVRNGVIYSSGNTVLGADCKGGDRGDSGGGFECTSASTFGDCYHPRGGNWLCRVKILYYSLISAKHGVLVDMDALDAIVIGGPSKMLIDIEITDKDVHCVPFTGGRPVFLYS